MKRLARERAFLIISVSSMGFDWWENHSGCYRLLAGSLMLGLGLMKREAIRPEDHSYEDPQLGLLRSTVDASLRVSSYCGTGLQVCSRVQSQAERLVLGGERTFTWPC